MDPVMLAMILYIVDHQSDHNSDSASVHSTPFYTMNDYTKYCLLEQFKNISQKPWVLFKETNMVKGSEHHELWNRSWGRHITYKLSINCICFIVMWIHEHQKHIC